MKWTPRELDVFINFTNPLLISNGLLSDKITIAIKDSSLFTSAVTGESLLPENMIVSEGASFPR